MATVTRLKSSSGKEMDVKTLLQQELKYYLSSSDFKDALKEALSVSLKEALNEAVDAAVKPLRDEIKQLPQL